MTRILSALQIALFHPARGTLRCVACGWTGARRDLVRNATGKRACPGCGGTRFQIINSPASGTAS